MPELLEISGIDYSQGLPSPDETGNLGQETGNSTIRWVLCGLGILATGIVLYGLFRKK